MGRHTSPRLKRSLGQVFLKTTWPCDKVVERVKGWQATRVLEIGPGGGILTRALLQAGLKVTAVEKDDRFAEKLGDFQSTNPKISEDLEIVNNDILKFDLEQWLMKSKEPTAIVGNIPYNISTPILNLVLPNLPHVVGVTFLVQLEFAIRLAALSNSKSYGSLSVYAQLRSRVTLDCKVPRNCFQPIPKVDSALISLVNLSKGYDAKTLQKAEHVTRLAFQQRRKKLSNAISSVIEKADLSECPIDLSRRPETLTPEEYIQLAEFFYPGDAEI